jgi:hypothetical protein
MKPTALAALLIVSFIYLSAAIPGRPRLHSPPAGGTAVPPRLFDNGEVARIAANGCEVVVQSAVWDAGCRCWIYTVVPASASLTQAGK